MSTESDTPLPGHIARLEHDLEDAQERLRAATCGMTRLERDNAVLREDLAAVLDRIREERVK